MKKFIKNTANSIRAKAIRLAATRRSGEGLHRHRRQDPHRRGAGRSAAGGPLRFVRRCGHAHVLNQRIKDMFNYAGALGG